jgi:hypothetical protein|tara:strand:+ start:1764 stop:2810 length:1047 start_codon:yes stop_codon:yes gene_type:complete
MAAKKDKKKRFDVRTVILVTVITLLVWLLAESRTVRSQVSELSPRLTAGTTSELLMRPAPNFSWPEAFKVTLTGSTAGLDQVARSLQGQVPLRLGIEVPATPGVHEIDLREVLRRLEVIMAAGVGVVEVSPDRLRVEVDAVSTVSLPVRVISPDGVAFDGRGTPTAVPNTVRATGPAGVLARLQGAEALVTLDAATVAGLTPGELETVRLRAEVPDDPDRWMTVFDPEFVDVVLTLKSRTQSLVLGAMPVQVLVAPGEVGRWRITLQAGAQDLVGVEVTGPSDQIERLRSGEVVPTALISLGFDELERGVESKRAQIQGLPPGVQVSPGSDLNVRLTIRRAEPEATEP